MPINWTSTNLGILMSCPTGLQSEERNDEVEEVCWADLEEAIGLLAFPAEKRILAKAKDLIV